MQRKTPDGTQRKLLDVSRINALGWQAGLGYEAGLQDIYRWFLGNPHGLRLQ